MAACACGKAPERERGAVQPGSPGLQPAKEGGLPGAPRWHLHRPVCAGEAPVSWPSILPAAPSSSQRQSLVLPGVCGLEKGGSFPFSLPGHVQKAAAPGVSGCTERNVVFTVFFLGSIKLLRPHCELRYFQHLENHTRTHLTI